MGSESVSEYNKLFWKQTNEEIIEKSISRSSQEELYSVCHITKQIWKLSWPNIHSGADAWFQMCYLPLSCPFQQSSSALSAAATYSSWQKASGSEDQNFLNFCSFSLTSVTWRIKQLWTLHTEQMYRCIAQWKLWINVNGKTLFIWLKNIK